MKETLAQATVAPIGQRNGVGVSQNPSLPGWFVLRLVQYAVGRPWIAVFAMVLAVYVATYYVLPGRVGGVLISQVIVPAMWLVVGTATILIARREGQSNIVFTRKFLWIGLLVGSFQVSAFLVAGMFQGFGNSPYASTIPGMLTNFVYVTSILFGMEISRAYLVTALGRRDLFILMAGIVVLFALVMVPPARYEAFNDSDATVRFVGRFMVPNLSESMLATFLAFFGGPVASIAYRGVMTGFEWFSLILPDLPWTTYFFLGTLPPLVSLVTIRGAFRQPGLVAEATPASEGRGLTLSAAFMTGVTGLLSVLLLSVILLNLGFLGFKSMVVISGSMSPTINVGDLVITREIPPQDLAVGDVVKFRRNGVDIVHRVIDVQLRDGEVDLTTKGDANNTVDRPGPSEKDVLGKTVMSIPKIGWLTIWLSQGEGG